MLRTIPLFKDLSDIDMEIINDLAMDKNVAKGNVVLTEGEIGDSLYAIVSGRVKVFIGDEDGREIILKILGPGDFFGEMSLIDSQPRSASVSTLENSVFKVLSHSAFETSVKKLGSGGMGDVYLARDRNLMNRETVVKLLKSETLANKEVVRKFKQEIEALARLKDPGIVTILDSGTHGKQPFLVLEYVEGEDLSLVISPVLFSVRDFLGPNSLAMKLIEQQSKVTRYFWQKFSSQARSVLSDNPSESETAMVLRDEFNRLLTDPKLAESEAFNETKFRMLIRNEAEWTDLEDLCKANRLLIEAVFAEEIVCGEDKKLTAHEAALIFRQLGAALTHGHEKGIIHRDLKPANIMITKDGRGEWQTKLIDFGVAKVRESLVAPSTQIGLSFGTRKYMSPEQANSKINLKPQTDIYALGLIAFEALTGQHIFRTDSFIEQCRMQEQEEFSEITLIRPDLSRRVREIIYRAVSFDPEKRQASAAEFGNTLADALLTRTVEILPVIPAPTIVSIPIKPVEAETAVLDRQDSLAIQDSLATQHNIATQASLAIQELEAQNPVKNSKKGVFVTVGIVAILVLVSLGSWLVWRNIPNSETNSKSETNPPPSATTVKRELNYKLIVQKYQQGKPFQTPFEATGDEIFGDGWRFKMSMNSRQNGNLYLLAENPKTQNLTILFPHPQKNKGASEVPANEKIETGEMEFDKTQGTEKFWIVWTEKPVSELEAVKSLVNPQDLGRIKDPEKEKAVRDFLDKWTNGEKPVEKVADDKQSKTISSNGDVLVKLAEFRHN